MVAWLIERPEEELALEAPPPPAVRRRPTRTCGATGAASLITVLAWLGASIAVSGLVLWGPTFLERILDISSDEAALLFLLVALGSFAGRLFFSFVPQRLGRRTCGLLMGFGAVPPLVLAAFSSDTEIAGRPAVPGRADPRRLLRRRRLREPRALHAGGVPHQPAHARHGARLGGQRPRAASSARW